MSFRNHITHRLTTVKFVDRPASCETNRPALRNATFPSLTSSRQGGFPVNIVKSPVISAVVHVQPTPLHPN